MNQKCNFCGVSMPQKKNKKFCSNKCRVFSFRENKGIKEPEFLKKGGFQPLEGLNEKINLKTIDGLKSLYKIYYDLHSEKTNLLRIKELKRSGISSDYSPSEKLEARKKNIVLERKKINWDEVINIENEIALIKIDLEKIKPYLNFESGEKGLISKEIERLKLTLTKSKEVKKPENIVTASELMKKNLSCYDFSKSEFEFLSNPGTAFICLISGEPGAGKTYFSLKFAEFLTKFGNVLFISNEEKMKFSLVSKLNSIFEGKEPSFNISDSFDIKEVLNYDFIFMDSINSIGASILDLKNLQSKNKNIIGILQSTKTGNYKGSKEFEHEADIMLYAETNKGISVKKNRF